MFAVYCSRFRHLAPPGNDLGMTTAEYALVTGRKTQS